MTTCYWQANVSSKYLDQKGNLPVLPTVEEAIVWANDLIAKISAAH